MAAGGASLVGTHKKKPVTFHIGLKKGGHSSSRLPLGEDL